MLCRFSFKNYKSYKNETIFDFQAAPISEFEESLIKTEKAADLLPVSVFYGPNAGGKTSLLQAFACLVTIIVNPIKALGKNRQPIILQQGFHRIPFKLDNTSKEDPTVFHVIFRINKNEYQYYLSLNEEIIHEALYWKSIGGKRVGTVFVRNGQDIQLGTSIDKPSINRSVNPKMPYLSFLAINYDITVIAEVQHWFESCIIRNYANPNSELTILDSDDIDYRRQLIHTLNDMDIDMAGYRYDPEKKAIITQRVINGNVFELPYNEESEGTKKLLSALPILLLALSEGRLVVFDELDAKLHPKLLRYVISLFKNPNLNKKGAQLLFTSHDLTTMKNTVFRRDEIWFAALDKDHSSEIYSLYDLRQEDNTHVKSTAAYDKQYLEGRYGADPYLSNMLNGGDWK